MVNGALSAAFAPGGPSRESAAEIGRGFGLRNAFLVDLKSSFAGPRFEAMIDHCRMKSSSAMFGSDILEVAIAMAFLYLFMSTIASASREAIEAFLKRRAKNLWRGISEMLRDGKTETMIEDFYRHPLISSLYKGDYKRNSWRLPSYIPKQNFSMAILDVVAGASTKGKVLSFADLETALKGTPPNPVQRVVLTAIAAAGHDLADIRKELEDWYDAAMERVAGWYTRSTALVLFIVGFGAAVVLNVDSITIAKRLIVDRPLRQVIVTQAETYSKEKGSERSAPIVPAPGSAGETKSSDNGPKPDATQDSRANSFTELRSEFGKIGFPIGWGLKTYGQREWPVPGPQACVSKPVDGGGTTFDCTKTCDNYWAIMALALMGWLVTAIAIMLGAPFWFDLLNKLVSLRSALKPADDAPPRNKAGAKSSGATQQTPQGG